LPTAFIEKVDEVRALENRAEEFDTSRPAVVPKNNELGFPTESVQSLTDELYSGKVANYDKIRRFSSQRVGEVRVLQELAERHPEVGRRVFLYVPRIMVICPSRDIIKNAD
jgi:hypothetical protein